MHKILTIFGTRPEAIKLAPVIKLLEKQKGIDSHICVTAQHRQMLDQVLRFFRIKPHYDLNLMKPDQSLAELTSSAISGLDKVLAKLKPELVLVQGDTTTVLAAAIAAFYRKIPLAHVEAGLRTWNMNAPWPEEANRVLCSRLASLHFCPTKNNAKNLLVEGCNKQAVYVTGNTVIDALFMTLKRIKHSPPTIHGVPDVLLKKRNQKIILITGHRRENFGEGFKAICEAIASLAKEFPDVAFIYPVHLNPNVRKPVETILRTRNMKNIFLIEPLPYVSFVYLMSKSYIILTDSGGVQEEAPGLGKPVLVMRETTERPEAVAAGAVKLVGTDKKRIVAETKRLLLEKSAYSKMSRIMNPYGDGKAASRIVKICANFVKKRKEQ
jgi:UDP-N-acetylglucosamine 2-epimerase (non-hydrolysing)